MSDPHSEVNPLDGLAEEFAARFRRGERPTIEEYVQRHPELAESIRQIFPTLVMMERIRPDFNASTGPGEKGPANPPKLDQVDDFRILRELGRGGMGVVYEAEQISLGRRVALKVLTSRMGDAKRLLRFQREARAAARLHHTNIVPVYGVGEQDGLHYYVMQFIQGQSLSEVCAEVRRLRSIQTESHASVAKSCSRIAHSMLTDTFSQSVECARPASASSRQSKPTPSATYQNAKMRSERSAPSETGYRYAQSIARIGRQIADALAYAHSQGILHRDIKPSNILLDSQGGVWITDFGLAKATDEHEDLTEAGDVVGTLRYIAPERFRGHEDVRTDVYSLGLTLYEL